MNVLIIAEYFPPDLGGSATRAYNVAKGLTLNRCRVTVVTAFPHYPHGKIPKEYRWKLIKVEWLGKTRVIRTFILPLASKGLMRRLLLFGSFVVSSLYALLLVGRIDVIWAANPDVISMLPAMIYKRVKKAPVVLNVDDLSLKDMHDLKMMKEGSATSNLATSITRKYYMKAQAVTPISPGYVETIERYGAERSKIHVVRGGVDLTIFKPGGSQHKSKRKFTVLYTGAFSMAYDFDQVLKAAKIMERKDPSVEFVLQGQGELASHMKSVMKELNLKNVRVMDKLLSREEVGKLLSQVDSLLLPLADFGEPYLGMSSKLYEYQAAGKPIICCADGQPAIYVKETKSGIVVKPGDHEGLAKSIIYLKKNPDVAQKMGRNGTAYVKRNLSISVIGLQMKEIFRTLIQNAARTG